MTADPSSDSYGMADDRGRRIRQASMVGTALFAVSAALGAAVSGGPVRAGAAVVAVALFVVGSLAYLAGYARAVRRSRAEVIGMAGLVFLRDCAPAPVRRQLLGATTVQVVVALATAAVRPFTSLAFGVLAPLFGLGLQTLWAARHGHFPARPAERRRTKPTQPTRTTRTEPTQATSSQAEATKAKSSQTGPAKPTNARARQKQSSRRARR